MGTLRSITNDDRNAITYRPRWRSETGSVLATILLQQISYRFEKNQDKPFYKFKEPCGHDLYREGDSWIEELGFSRTEFDTAIEKIGQKISRKTPRDPNKLVWYWITPERVTWYELNVVAYETMLERIYVNQESCVTKSGNPDLRSAGILRYENQDSRDRYTETTTETTTEINKGGSNLDRALPDPTALDSPPHAKPVEESALVSMPEPARSQTAFHLPGESAVENAPAAGRNRGVSAAAVAATVLGQPEPTKAAIATPFQPAVLPSAQGVEGIVNAAKDRFSGVSHRNAEHRYIDGIAKQYTTLGLTSEEFTGMVNAFLAKYGMEEMVNLDTDHATKMLARAQSVILSLCGTEKRFRSVAGLQSVFDSWAANDWRGDTLPSGDQLIEHAGKMKANVVVCERKDTTQAKGQNNGYPNRPTTRTAPRSNKRMEFIYDPDAPV